MGSLIVVVPKPFIKVMLEFFYRPVDFLPEGNLIKLLQDCLVEPFADAIGLWMCRLCLRMLDIIYCKVELVIVVFCLAAVFCSTVSKDPDDSHAL